MEALLGLNLNSNDSSVAFIPQWSPLVKENRSIHQNITITNDYYLPLQETIQRIKEKAPKQTEIIGRIKQLAIPSVDNRNGGEVWMVFLDEHNKPRTVNAILGKEDYNKALVSHQYGKMVKVLGALTDKGRLRLEDVSLVSIE